MAILGTCPACGKLVPIREGASYSPASRKAPWYVLAHDAPDGSLCYPKQDITGGR